VAGGPGGWIMFARPLQVAADLGSVAAALWCVRAAGAWLVPGGWPGLWGRAVAARDPHTVYVVGAWCSASPAVQGGGVAVLLAVYWGPALLYTMADTLRPSWLYRYKVLPFSWAN
jgi:hypothetical protein